MTSRKRIKAIIPSIAGGGGGGPAPGGTIEIGPDYGEASGSDGSTYTSVSASALDGLEIEALPVSQAAVALTEVELEADLNSVSSLDLDSVDLEASASTGSAIALDVDVTASAQADLYLDRGNGTSNFGGATGLLHKLNTPVVNDDKNAYIAWDLTAFTTGTVDSADITIWTTHNSLTATSFNWQFYTHGSQPFVENTATWDANEPPPGTQRQTGSSATFPNSGAFETISLNATSRANMLGNWVYLRLTGGGLATVTFTTSSREHATTSQRPVLTMTVSI